MRQNYCLKSFDEEIIKENYERMILKEFFVLEQKKVLMCKLEVIKHFRTQKPAVIYLN